MNRTQLIDSDAIGVAVILLSSINITILPNSTNLAFNYETTVIALLLRQILIGLFFAKPVPVGKWGKIQLTKHLGLSKLYFRYIYAGNNSCAS